MKINKLIIFLFLAGVLFSCSEQESILEETNAVESLDLAADLSTYTDSFLGMYKGVFTTEDSQDRGTLEIKVINDKKAEAKITHLNGVAESFNGSVQEQTASATNGEMNIVFNSSTSRSSSFVFIVSDNGSNPTITDAYSNSIASFITVVKENTRGAVVPVSGQWTTSDLSFTGTFNLMFSGAGEGNDAALVSQMMVGMYEVGSMTGNSQANCVDDGIEFTTCDLTGASLLADNMFAEVAWTGTHTYGTDVALVCSDLLGDFTATGVNGTNFSGTWVVDSMTTCQIPAEDLCANAAAITCGDSLSSITNFASMTGQPGGFCGTSPSSAGGVWYTFTGSGDGNEITLNTVGSNFDTKLFVYSGSCGELVCITGNDDCCGTAASQVVFVEETGVTYYILLAGFNTGVGTSILNMSCVALAPVCGGTVTVATGTAPSAITAICSGLSTNYTAVSSAVGTIGVDADIDNVTVVTTFLDLNLTLLSPLGTSLALSVAANTPSGSFDAIYRDGANNPATGVSGELAPQGGTFAATFSGESVNGNWQLEVCDLNGTAGTLSAWSIGFCDGVIQSFTNGGSTDRSNNANEARRLRLQEKELLYSEKKMKWLAEGRSMER